MASRARRGGLAWGVALLAGVLLTGCVTEGNFGAKYAKASCGKLAECGLFVVNDDGLGEFDEAACRDEAEEAWFFLEENLAALGCEADYQLGAECVREVRDASCDAFATDIIAACEDMVVCGGG